MGSTSRKQIRFRGRDEAVLDTFRVRGRNYFVLEKLSRRGAFRVYDPQAAPGGGYRALYRLPASRNNRQKVAVLKRLVGPMANRNFPGIVEFTPSGGDLFVVVDWVWGTNLRDYLRAVRKGRTPHPSVTETVRLMRGLAHGLGHYHRKANIIHGDVSPANVVISSGTKQLVLIDFGSAWPAEQTAMKDCGDGITFPYAAPERQAHHAAEDFRSDVFSHAVLAYEMLTLQIPYDGLGGKAGLPEFVDRAGESLRQPSDLLRQADRLPRAAIEQVDAYFRRALALHPDKRFATRREWLSAWDKLHDSCKKGDRLSAPARVALRVIESLTQLIDRRQIR